MQLLFILLALGYEDNCFPKHCRGLLNCTLYDVMVLLPLAFLCIIWVKVVLLGNFCPLGYNIEHILPVFGAFFSFFRKFKKNRICMPTSALICKG